MGDSGLSFQGEPALLDGAERRVDAELCSLLQTLQQINVTVGGHVEWLAMQPWYLAQGLCYHGAGSAELCAWEARVM